MSSLRFILMTLIYVQCLFANTINIPCWKELKAKIPSSLVEKPLLIDSVLTPIPDLNDVLEKQPSPRPLLLRERNGMYVLSIKFVMGYEQSTIIILPRLVSFLGESMVGIGMQKY